MGRGLNPGLSPRVRGNRPPTDQTLSRLGLSPRVRGNRDAEQQHNALHRSIPACAGEPGAGGGGRGHFQVYPRVCGGTFRGQSLDGSVQGLSPRVRGNLADAVELLGAVRSIPACAGEPG